MKRKKKKNEDPFSLSGGLVVPSGVFTSNFTLNFDPLVAGSWPTAGQEPKPSEPLPVEQVELPMVAHRAVALRPTPRGVRLTSPTHWGNGNDLGSGEPAVCHKLDAGQEMANTIYALMGGQARHVEPDHPAPEPSCSCGYYSVPIDQPLNNRYAGYEALVLIGGRIIEEETTSGITYRSSHMVVQELRVPPCQWCGRQVEHLTLDHDGTARFECLKHRCRDSVTLDRDDLACVGVPVRFLTADDMGETGSDE